jgi:glycosyltransferase involved in cell wall biosynthesis
VLKGIRLAVVAPRYPLGATVGGAETLLKSLAHQAAALGAQVDFLTTCARDHFTWKNELEPGVRPDGPVRVHYFPVDDNRNIEAFLKAQGAICSGGTVTPSQENIWFDNNVNASALYAHLADHEDDYDAILAGPYLFSLTVRVAQQHPKKTILVPCLHDEDFAKLSTIAEMFRTVRKHLFNSEPERALATEMYGIDPAAHNVVGMGMEPFTSDPARFRRNHKLDAPYVIYCGRREMLKGTPLLLHYIDAFRNRTGIDLHIVLTGAGDIDPPPRLKPALLDLGFVSEEEKHDAMAGAVAFCHPSVNESFGIVLMESWLAGRPALVHAGSKVLAHHCRTANGGLWFRHYPDFELQLKLLLDQPETATQMGSNGHAYVQREFSPDAIARKLANAILDVCTPTE